MKLTSSMKLNTKRTFFRKKIPQHPSSFPRTRTSPVGEGGYMGRRGGSLFLLCAILCRQLAAANRHITSLH